MRYWQNSDPPPSFLQDPDYVTLQQKLKLRKALDQDIENLIYTQIIKKQQLTEQQHVIRRSHLHQMQLAESQLKYREYIERILRDKGPIQDDNPLLTHDMRLYEKQVLLGKLQENQLHQAMKRSRQAQQILNAELCANYPDIQYSDEQLIEQYENGTRAREIQNMIESYRKNPFVHQTKPIKNVYLNSSANQSPHLIKNNKFPDQSPYSNLKEKQPSYSNRNQKELSYSNRKEREVSHSNRKQRELSHSNFNDKVPSFQKSKQKKIQRHSPSKSIQNFSQKDVHSYLQPKYNSGEVSEFMSKPNEPRNNHKAKKGKNIQQKQKRNSKYASKSHRDKSALNNSSKVINSEGMAMKRIQNRLKLSKCVFKDSKFRNLKHEYFHLQMTYENEVRSRKEIKDKINKDPSVLKNYAMVVEKHL